MHTWPVIMQPPQAARGGGAVEVGVAQHDHRILAAELEQHRREPPAGALHHAPAGLRRAGDADHVDVVDERRAGLARADHHLQHARRAARGSSPATARRTASGVSSDGLMTTALPASSAGTASPSARLSGAFHGLMMPTTPRGL